MRCALYSDAMNGPAKSALGDGLKYPRSVALARLPTPVESLASMGAPLGVDLWCKRDDLTGAALTGNKVRKLEFLLGDALGQGADSVLTCGGEQSNHCRATAVAASLCGLRSSLLLRVDDPAQPPALHDNSLLARWVGADIEWVSRPQYADRKRLFAERADALRATGRKPYIIPEGGSNAVGAWGYVRAVEELATQMPFGPLTIVYAAGSGGTGAGLLLGVQRLDLPWRVVGINVCDDRDYFVNAIGEICDEFVGRFGGAALPRERIEIIDGYVGRGYALSTESELTGLRDIARKTGLLFDPVYTGKAFLGLCAELKKGTDLGQRIVFLHTGGIFGLTAKAAEMAPLAT